MLIEGLFVANPTPRRRGIKRGNQRGESFKPLLLTPLPLTKRRSFCVIISRNGMRRAKVRSFVCTYVRPVDHSSR